MAVKRLNDTAAIIATPLGEGESHSTSVEKIDNGYLVCRSSWNPRTGQSKSSKVFSETEPRVMPEAMEANGVGNSSLRDTMSYLSDGENGPKGRRP